MGQGGLRVVSGLPLCSPGRDFDPRTGRGRWAHGGTPGANASQARRRHVLLVLPRVSLVLRRPAPAPVEQGKHSVEQADPGLGDGVEQVKRQVEQEKMHVCFFVFLFFFHQKMLNFHQIVTKMSARGFFR